MKRRCLINFAKVLPYKISNFSTRVNNSRTLIVMNISQIDTYPLVFDLLKIDQMNNRLAP